MRVLQAVEGGSAAAEAQAKSKELEEQLAAKTQAMARIFDEVRTNKEVTKRAAADSKAEIELQNELKTELQNELKHAQQKNAGTVAAAARNSSAQLKTSQAEITKLKKQILEQEAEHEELALQLAEFQQQALQRGDDSEDSLDTLRDELRLAKKALVRAEKGAESKAQECERKNARIEKLQVSSG